MRIQISLTVSESKGFIAKGIKNLPLVAEALKAGKVIIKGGTTTSAISEEICGQPLRLSGRVTLGGALTANSRNVGAHSILIEGGKVQNIDDIWDETVSKLSAEDVYITGANVIDAFGHAGILCGVEGGGPPGKSLSSIYVTGVNVMVAAGTEKMVPGDLQTHFSKVGRNRVDVSYGAAVGLLPIWGTLFTEIDAIRALAAVDCFPLAKGGIFGMEGGTTVIVEGETGEVKKIDSIYQRIRGCGVSGVPESLANCQFPNLFCKLHTACIYKLGKKACFE